MARLAGIDLELVFQQQPHSPAAREVIRNQLRVIARRRSHERPLTGAYYWVPDLARRGHLVWRVKEFFDVWLPNSDHVYVWQHIRDVLEDRWKRSLACIGYCSLPRGRVCRTRVAGPDHGHDSRVVIYHGEDSPLGAAGLKEVRKKFQLPATTPTIFDEHEQRIPGETESLARVLGIDLELSACNFIDLDW